MKSSIKALVGMADDANKRVKANAHNQEVNDKKSHEAKTTQMAEDIATLKKKLAELVAENKEKEQTLRKVRGAIRSSQWSKYYSCTVPYIHL